jgi:hypothetical protein
MEPYEDINCECYSIENQINVDYPESNWNCDNACSAWAERSKNLKLKNIEYQPYDDANYACCCPTCGRIICGWCV